MRTIVLLALLIAGQGTNLVHFHELGDVTIMSHEISGDVISLQFIDAKHVTLFTAHPRTAGMGYRSEDFWTIYKDQPPREGTSPRTGYLIRHIAGLPDPLVIAAFDSPGGSDCAYSISLIGEQNGRLKYLSPPGYAIGINHKTGVPELIEWNMIWRSGEVHADPHDSLLHVYEFRNGRFFLSRRFVVGKNSNTPIKLDSYESIIPDLPDFGC